MSIDKRKTKRVKKNIIATIHSLMDQLIVECIVRDLSEGGARLYVQDFPEVVPDYFKLNMQGIIPKCRVRWRSGNELGIEFYKDETSVVLL